MFMGSNQRTPKGEWWLEPLDVIDEVDQRSDIITVQAKKLGFGLWVLQTTGSNQTPLFFLIGIQIKIYKNSRNDSL